MELPLVIHVRLEKEGSHGRPVSGEGSYRDGERARHWPGARICAGGGGGEGGGQRPGCGAGRHGGLIVAGGRGGGGDPGAGRRGRGQLRLGGGLRGGAGHHSDGPGRLRPPGRPGQQRGDISRHPVPRDARGGLGRHRLSAPEGDVQHVPARGAS